MTPKQISLVQDSWKKVLPIAPQAAEIFYDTLFEMDPALKPLFPDEGLLGNSVTELQTLISCTQRISTPYSSPCKIIWQSRGKSL